MVNLYSQFIPHAARLMRSLEEALKEKRDSEDVDWSLDRVQTFEGAKAALANDGMLAHLTPAAPIALTTDASYYAVGSVCEQLVANLLTLSWRSQWK